MITAKSFIPPVDQPRSQGSLLPTLRRAAVTAGRREPGNEVARSLVKSKHQTAQKRVKKRGFWLELKWGERAQVRTEMVEFIALPFQFPSKLKIWSFHVVVVQWRQRNVQKSVMPVQSCCFAHQTYCFLRFPLPSSSWFRKVRIIE